MRSTNPPHPDEAIKGTLFHKANNIISDMIVRITIIIGIVII
jgi:hypothetical protein